jgi:CRISPR-associated protein Cas2
MSQSTLYVIAYDIPDDKRRTKVHKILCGFGGWTQYSLFECFLNARELVQLRARLHDIIKPTEDSVRLYPLCAACVGQVETIGGAAPCEHITYVV